MKPYNELCTFAKKYGWKFHKIGGKHDIWISRSGNTIPFPAKPVGKTLAAYKNKIRRLS